MCCKAGTVLHILWKAKHFSMLVENRHLGWFEYVDFHIQVNPFTANPGYWQMCVGYIFVWSTSSPHHDEVTTDPKSLSMKCNIFPLISNIILPKVLTLPYPEQHETLALVYWNLYMVLKCYIEKLIDVSELHKTRTTKTPEFWGYPRRLMITLTIESYWIPSQKKTKSQLKF